MTLRYVSILAVCLGLSACNSTGGAELLKQLATDPNCAHHDEAEVIVGAAGLPASAHVHVTRDCPARPSQP